MYTLAVMCAQDQEGLKIVEASCRCLMFLLIATSGNSASIKDSMPCIPSSRSPNTSFGLQKTTAGVQKPRIHKMPRSASASGRAPCSAGGMHYKSAITIGQKRLCKRYLHWHGLEGLNTKLQHLRIATRHPIKNVAEAFATTV